MRWRWRGAARACAWSKPTRPPITPNWPVRDDAAALLTVATKSANRRGVPRAAALRQVMLALMHDWRIPQSANPAIWAPLVLVDQRATSDR